MERSKLERMIRDRDPVLDDMFFESYGILREGVSRCPYWLEVSGRWVQYVEGAYDEYKHGDEIVVDGVTYRYVDSVSLHTEIEHQADDGGLLYETRGYSFLRVLERIGVVWDRVEDFLCFLDGWGIIYEDEDLVHERLREYAGVGLFDKVRIGG